MKKIIVDTLICAHNLFYIYLYCTYIVLYYINILLIIIYYKLIILIILIFKMIIDNQGVIKLWFIIKCVRQ